MLQHLQHKTILNSYMCVHWCSVSLCVCVGIKIDNDIYRRGVMDFLLFGIQKPERCKHILAPRGNCFYIKALNSMEPEKKKDFAP